MSEHTKTPWVVDAMGNIWGEDTKIADMSVQPTQDNHSYREKSDEEHRANARHIVHCVNNHERLVGLIDAAVKCHALDEADWMRKARALLASLEAEKGGEL